MEITAYKRVLLKLSGAILTSNNNSVISDDRLDFISRSLKKAYDKSIEMIIVIGGGNLIRGQANKSTFINRLNADYMGMIATAINALALQSALIRIGLNVYIQSAIEIPGIIEKYHVQKNLNMLDKKHIIILAGGTGNPFVSTDSAASLRAIELKAQILLKATNVDGIYTSDPKKNKEAKLLKSLTYNQVLYNQYNIMDLSAFIQCKEYQIPICIFNALKKNSLENALLGNHEGTFVT